MRTILPLFGLLMLFFTANAQNSIGDITKADCFLDDCSTFQKDATKAEFGYITVPEDYSKPEGTTYQMAFIIVKAKDPNPKPDPVMFFDGGWGNPTLKNVAMNSSIVNFPDRDVIFFDRRGSGFSEPQLCDWMGSALVADKMANISNEQVQKNQAKQVNECLDSLQERNIDFNQFGYDNQSKDVILLLENLNYNSYNLFGISNGSWAIQKFLYELKPGALNIRSITMDSCVPMETALMGTGLTNYARTLDNLLKDCENDLDCNSAYPDLKNRYVAFLKTIETEPLEVPLDENTIYHFNKQEVNDLILLLSSIYQSHVYVPMVMNALINRNITVLAPMIGWLVASDTDSANGLGFIDMVYEHKLYQEESNKDYMASLNKFPEYEITNGEYGFYPNDKRIKPQTLKYKWVKSDIPTLILGGQNDPLTPIEWTRAMRPHYKNHYYFEFPKLAHATTATPCVFEIALKFVNDPSEKPSSNCIKELESSKTQFIIQK